MYPLDATPVQQTNVYPSIVGAVTVPRNPVGGVPVSLNDTIRVVTLEPVGNTLLSICFKSSLVNVSLVAITPPTSICLQHTDGL